MLKRAIFFLVAGVFLISNIAVAASQVNIAQGDIQADFSYQNTHNKETYNGHGWHEDRNVDGHALEYGVNIGFKNNYAMSIGVGNYRYDFFDDNHQQYTRPKLDSINLNVQKQIADNVAVFAGMRHTSGSWSYHNSANPPLAITKDNISKNTAVIGFIAEKELTKQINAYIKADAGHDFQEYKIGLTHANFNLGYGYTKYQNIRNSEFDTFPEPVDGLDLVTKGIYFGIENKF